MNDNFLEKLSALSDEELASLAKGADGRTGDVSDCGANGEENGRCGGFGCEFNSGAGSDKNAGLTAAEISEQALAELLKRYKNVVSSVARGYFLSGGDTDDLLQEGMIGVFRAIASYNGSSAFRPYAYKCIKTGIISAIKRSNANKNKPLNNFVSLSVYDGNDADKNELMRGEVFNPEEAYINMESEKELIRVIKQTLSKLEYEVLSLYLQGFSYADIAAKTNKNVKSVDNTVQRIRNKLEQTVNI